jgi:hypothetical protein
VAVVLAAVHESVPGTSQPWQLPRRTAGQARKRTLARSRSRSATADRRTRTGDRTPSSPPVRHVSADARHGRAGKDFRTRRKCVSPSTTITGSTSNEIAEERICSKNSGIVGLVGFKRRPTRLVCGASSLSVSSLVSKRLGSRYISGGKAVRLARRRFVHLLFDAAAVPVVPRSAVAQTYPTSATRFRMR